MIIELLGKQFFLFTIIRMYKRMSPHGDFDHMGEAINFVNNFKVEKVIFKCGEFNYLEKILSIYMCAIEFSKYKFL